jgi:hypothetical protein
VAKTLESKPQLVQLSSAWSTREGAPLGRNRYVELEIKKPKSNGTGSKVAPYHKPCEKMTEAVVMDGGCQSEHRCQSHRAEAIVHSSNRADQSWFRETSRAI